MTCVSIHQFLAVEESALQHSGVDNSEVRNTLAFNYETPPNNQICDKWCSRFVIALLFLVTDNVNVTSVMSL